MPFRFKIDPGVRVEQELYSLMKGARSYGLHGDVQFIHAKSAGVFDITLSDGSVKRLHGDIRLHNMLLHDMHEEPKRREAYKASKALARESDDCRPLASGLDERMAAKDTPAPIDQDAAHHRGAGFGRW